MTIASNKGDVMKAVVGGIRWALFAVIVVGSLAACGGGSTGTDNGGSAGRGAEFRGYVDNGEGSPIARAIITLQQTGEYATTDQAGNFTLKSHFVGKNAALEVRNEGTVGSTTIDRELAEGSVVTLALSLLEGSRLVIVSQNITTRAAAVDSEEAIPTPTSGQISVATAPRDENRTPGSTPRPTATLKSIFQGSVRYSIGTPVSGAVVTISESKDRSITDQNGTFSLERPTQRGKATLTVTIYGVSLSIDLKNIPNESVYYTVELIVEFPDARRPSTIGEFSPTISFGELKKSLRK